MTMDELRAWLDENDLPLGEPLDMEMSKYLWIPAVSASGLKKIRKSPAHLIADRARTESKHTPDTLFGEAVHAHVLEHRQWREEWVIGPEGKWTLKAAKDAIAKLVEDGYERERILKPDVHSRVEAAGDSVFDHPYAGGLFRAKGHTEQVFLWEDPETGLICKIRPDHVATELATAIDLKKTIDASEGAFSRSVYKFDYHWSAWFYREGLKQCGLEVDEYVFVAIEDQAPHGCMVYPIDDHAEEYAGNQCRRQMTRWAECEASGDWPCYPSDPKPITLPDYAWRQIEEELENE